MPSLRLLSVYFVIMATLYHVRKSSLEDETKSLRYVGIRNISDTEKIKEEDIVAKDGTVIGVKNRVRAGLQHFGGHVQEVNSYIYYNAMVHG